jgi:ALG3 protein
MLSFSIAISVKMSVLLYLPAYLVVLVKQRGLVNTIRLCLTIFSVQGLLAYPFILERPFPYVKTAFNFGRVFLYQWTVNWRFLSEERFLDPNFAKALLVGHVSVLVAFGLFRWCRTSGGVLAVLGRAIQYPSRPGSSVPVRADGTYAGSAGFLNYSQNAYRGHYNCFHVQPYRNTVFALITLPILLVVCLSGAPVGMEDALSHLSKVRVLSGVSQQSLIVV